MSLDDYVRRLTTTITSELQAPIEQSLHVLLGEVMEHARHDREAAVRILEEQLATLRADFEATEARAEAERQSLLEQHAAALTALRDEITAEVGQAVLLEARQMASDEQAAAEEHVRALCLSERESSEQSLRDQLAAERQTAEQELLARLNAEHETALQGLRDQLAAEREAAERELTARLTAEQDTALQALRDQLAAERDEAERELTARFAAERESSEQVLRGQVTAERDAAERELTARRVVEREAGEQALRERLATEREVGEQERLAQLAAEQDTALQALRDELSREHEQQMAELEQAHQHALAQLRADQMSERTPVDEALSGDGAAGRGALEQALRAELSAEREAFERALRAEISAQLSAEHDVAEQVLRTQLSVEREAAEQALRAQLMAEREASERALRAQLAAERETAEQTIRQSLAGDFDERLEEARAQQAGPGEERLLAALRQLDAATTLTDALGVLLEQAAALSGRAAIFLAAGERVRGWRQAGFDEDVSGIDLLLHAAGCIGRAVQTSDAVPAGDQLAEESLPSWMVPPAGRAAVAVPVAVGGRPVAVLYCDGQQSPALQILVRHAARGLEILTISRATAPIAPSVSVPSPSEDVRRSEAGPESDSVRQEESARRYARLLISELKLYNETAVEEGRLHRDLLARLGPEVERARRLYEEKIPAVVRERADWFDEELVRTLAGGDASMLGQVT